jgi:superfamily II DNA or RNA helicase
MAFQLNPGYSLDPHQVTAVDFVKSRRDGGAALWLETGLGKGFIGAHMLIEWLNTPKLNRALVACPAGLTVDWKQKLWEYANIDASIWDEDENHINCIQIISHNLLQEPKKVAKSGRRNRVPDVIKWHPDIILVDEAHKCKSYKASQTKGLLKIAKAVGPSKRLSLTATPTTTINPEELRPQLLFVDAPLLERQGVADWMQYRRKFCKIEREAYGGMSVDKVVGCKNQSLLDSIIEQVCLKQTADILNLPEGFFTTTYFSISSKAQRLYKKMANEGAILQHDLEVVTSNALDRAIRCSQIRSGFVTDFEKQDHDLDDTMVNTVMEMTRNTPLPLLIVYRFRPTGDHLELALAKAGLRVGHIRGGVSPAKKSSIEQSFQAGDLDVVLGQYAAVSLGLTFTRGNHVIFAEPTFSLEEWIQTLGRIRRRGQTKTCFYHRVMETGSMDWACYDSLDKKEDFAEKITRGVVRMAA